MLNILSNAHLSDALVSRKNKKKKSQKKEK